MSLINEALKKAQRQRAAEAGLEQPGPEPGAVVVARAAPRNARTVALMTLGAGVAVLALALLTYVLTTHSSTVVTGPARPAVKAAPIAQKPDSAQPATPPAEKPVTTEPVASAPSVPPAPPAPVIAAGTTSTTVSTSAPVVSPPSDAKAPVQAPEPSAMPPPTTPAVAAVVVPSTPVPPQPAVPAATAPPAPKPNEQVQAFVDAVRVTGIRASGEDSRVLMNGRHYRLNEVVERTLGIRLVKVEGNCLTFADPNGVTYLKYF